MLKAARHRAKVKGIEFSITVSDIKIPAICPVLGMKLKARSARGPIDCSPSLDRIDSSKGYVPGNVAVISFRANALKRDATLDELKKLVAWLEDVTANGVRAVDTESMFYIAPPQ